MRDTLAHACSSSWWSALGQELMAEVPLILVEQETNGDQQSLALSLKPGSSGLCLPFKPRVPKMCHRLETKQLRAFHTQDVTGGYTWGTLETKGHRSQGRWKRNGEFFLCLQKELQRLILLSLSLSFSVSLFLSLPLSFSLSYTHTHMHACLFIIPW